MSEFILQLANGTRIVVPASLNSITTYVLLEQEAWFEKEVAFLDSVLRPGMTAIDVGANLGVYSLPMARLVGPAGRVIAYEPGTAPRMLLERSKQLNRFENLEIVAAALSDREREGSLSMDSASELNRLSATGVGERVRVTSLDLEESGRGWDSPTFVKIDAEGEEENILRGGLVFFQRHSPLVMFEIKAGNVVNEQLRAAFPAMGYRVYRLLAGAPILVPDRADQPLDPYELNLFAAKPDRAAILASEGLLVNEVETWQPGESARGEALKLWAAQPFAVPFSPRLRAPVDAEYEEALGAYAVWRSAEVSLSRRCAALDFAWRALAALCERAPTFARLSTLARASFEAGHRGPSVQALNVFIEAATREKVHVDEPFWPACPRYDRLDPGEAIDEWVVGAAVEQFERTASYSSVFGGPSTQLDWLCRRPFASAEMERRKFLRAIRDGRSAVIPPRLRASAADHLNAGVWRAGLSQAAAS